MATSVVMSACARRRNPALHIVIPTSASWDAQYLGSASEPRVVDYPVRRGREDSLSDSSSPALVAPTSGNLRQTSLPTPTSDGRKSPGGEPKSILKHGRFSSESGGSYESASPDCDVQFLESFRSVDDLYTGSTEDVSGFRKRVSFSEKIMKTTYRPGACILQSKLKAQKRREKRNGGRRTSSESDVADVGSLTDYDSGMEMDGSPNLEELVEADEDMWSGPDAETGSARKKKRNRKGRNHKTAAV